MGASKSVKFAGPFIWHHHEKQHDSLFRVVRQRLAVLLSMHFPNKALSLWLNLLIYKTQMCMDNKGEFEKE